MFGECVAAGPKTCDPGEGSAEIVAGGGEALLEQCHQPLLAHALAPACKRRTLEGQLVAEEFRAAEILIIRALEPALA